MHDSWMRRAFDAFRPGTHFGDYVYFRVSGSKDLYLHQEKNSWLTIKSGKDETCKFVPLSAHPGGPAVKSTDRLWLGQGFYLKSSTQNSFVHLGPAADLDHGNFFYSDDPSDTDGQSLDRTVFRMIDWPKAMEAQWGDVVKLATTRGQLRECVTATGAPLRACIDPATPLKGVAFVLESAIAGSVPAGAAKKAKKASAGNKADASA